SQGKLSRLALARPSGLHWAKAPRASCTSWMTSSLGLKAIRKAQSLAVASRNSSRLRRTHSSTVSRRMFWKSTAIFVHATSIPRTGLEALPLQASAERMSEAVNSAGLSGGRIDIDPGPSYESSVEDRDGPAYPTWVRPNVISVLRTHLGT